MSHVDLSNEIETCANQLVGITDGNALFVMRSDRSVSVSARLSIHEHSQLAEILVRTLRDRLDEDSRLG